MPEHRVGKNDESQIGSVASNESLGAERGGAIGTSEVAATSEIDRPGGTPRRGWGRWVGWQFWMVALVLVFGGLGYTATSMLLNLPALSKSCASVYWPLASASRRLYCAQAKAETRTRDGLLEAIALVNGLPADHPMHAEGERFITEWTEELLVLGEAKFQTGKLDEAIALAQAIPDDLDAAHLADERIDRWREVWAEGEALQEIVQERILELDWSGAFGAVVKLASVDNDYWSGRRYEALVKEIQRARLETRQLQKARAAFERGNFDDLKTALALAEEVESGSFGYEAAQVLIARIGDNMLALARQEMDAGNWAVVREITIAVPNSLDLDEQVRDLLDLTRAGTQAATGTIAGIEVAISRAQLLGEDRPLYYKAQQLIDRWELEIVDVRHLNRARKLAEPGTLADLQGAIAEADKIPSRNPRYREARAAIGDWTRDIQTIQDQPTLNRAVLAAQGNSIPAWQEAIAIANRIGAQRALYDDAQTRVRQWRANIQRAEDRPILSRATSLASTGRLQEAVATAERIGRGRVLYPDAQNKIALWRAQLRGAELLQRAYRTAEPGSPEALAAAIQTADRIPTVSSSRRAGDRAIARWSERLLGIATRTADRDPAGAIRIAELIPANSRLGSAAQVRIAEWQTRLRPEPLVSEPDARDSAVDAAAPSADRVDTSIPEPALPANEGASNGDGSAAIEAEVLPPADSAPFTNSAPLF
ncbi:hypothetical protein KR51_00004070 [Rubidibacter lacunae KORDI 51-2]|uniref:Chromosome segregation ATPase n=1 Tax=Rubidibacter lacunae KORDI 51-2 TaxID=582515 RepID=U5DQI0_9CHRO|nr:hypothetical protein [Rubidibacter lacunae]ERN42879.1 hypothetical protein KR51_00004070 [Rubidibacter lacunae KORDI 51-2]